MAGRAGKDDSARWLIDLGKQAELGTVKRQRIGDNVLAALAIHRGNFARDALGGMARNDARKETRRQAVFWLAQVRGAEGSEITSSVMFNDQDPDVRKHAAFALGQSKSPGVAADLIRLGNTDQVGDVRAQAWFWLAQSESDAAQAYLERVLTAHD
jgi:HEAT repeat protein